MNLYDFMADFLAFEDHEEDADGTMQPWYWASKAGDSFVYAGDGELVCALKANGEKESDKQFRRAVFVAESRNVLSPLISAVTAAIKWKDAKESTVLDIHDQALLKALVRLEAWDDGDAPRVPEPFGEA